MKTKLALVLVALMISLSSYAGVIVTSRSGTYMYDVISDCGGCFGDGTCLDVVVTPGNVAISGHIEGDYHVDAIEGKGPFLIKIYDGGLEREYQVTSYDQVLQSDGSVRFTYQIAE